jgi:hypothetical protein
MERTEACTEREKKRGYATKLHGWSPLQNLVGLTTRLGENSNDDVVALT